MVRHRLHNLQGAGSLVEAKDRELAHSSTEGYTSWCGVNKSPEWLNGFDGLWRLLEGVGVRGSCKESLGISLVEAQKPEAALVDRRREEPGLSL